MKTMDIKEEKLKKVVTKEKVYQYFKDFNQNDDSFVQTKLKFPVSYKESYSIDEISYSTILLELWKKKLIKRENDKIKYQYTFLDDGFIYRQDEKFLKLKKQDQKQFMDFVVQNSYNKQYIPRDRSKMQEKKEIFISDNFNYQDIFQKSNSESKDSSEYERIVKSIQSNLQNKKVNTQQFQFKQDKNSNGSEKWLQKLEKIIKKKGKLSNYLLNKYHNYMISNQKEKTQIQIQQTVIPQLQQSFLDKVPRKQVFYPNKQVKLEQYSGQVTDNEEFLIELQTYDDSYQNTIMENDFTD